MKNNKNILILTFLIILCMIAALVIINPRPDNSLKPFLSNPSRKERVLVYFSKSKGSETVTEAVFRNMPKPEPKTKGELLKFTISELLKGPTEKEKDSGYFSEIPRGTKLISVEESPKRIDINLSGEFTAGGGSSSMVQRLQELTKTVASVPPGKSAYLKVEGKQLNFLGGEGVIVHEPITSDPGVTQ